MRRNVIVNGTISVVVIVALCAISEWYFRQQSVKVRRVLGEGFDPAELCTAASPDRRLIYTYVPGRCGVNSHGYVDAERTFEKPEGTFRIIIIGDSVAEGHGVGIEERFGSVLERLLDESAPGGRYEVIVLARAGYSTSQEIELLRNDAFRYDPDLIIWSYCLNDPADPVYHNANGHLGAYYYRPRSHLLARIHATIFRIGERLRARRCPEEFHALLHCVYRGEITRNIGTIAGIVSRRGVPLVFAIHPILQQAGFATYTLEDVHRSLVSAVEGTGMIACDLLPAFRGYDSDAVKLHDPKYYDPWHFNALGHRITAEYLYDALRDRDLLSE